MIDTSPQPNVTAHGEAFVRTPRFWALVLATGLGTGLAGGCLMRLLRFIEHHSYPFAGTDFLDDVAHSSRLHRVEMLFAAGVIAGVSVYLLPRVDRSKPVGLVKAIWFRSGKLPFLFTMLKALLSIVIVGMGMSLGREGALKDAGAAIASKLADWFHMAPGERRLLAACAAGAGMAAAYNIPLGGALFGVEVLLGTLTFSAVMPALATSMIATATSWLLLGDKVTYQMPSYTLQKSDLLWAVLCGPLFGLASVLWVRGIGWADRRKPERWHKVVAPIVLLTLVGVLAMLYPDLLGNGKGLVQRALTNELALGLMLPLVLLRFVVTIGCLSSGAPGGVFTPTMTFGALLGGILGKLWAMILPGTEVGVLSAIGSAAVLAVATQGPVSSIVMVMELTNHVDAMIVPVLLATVGAALTAHWLEPKSVYSAPVHGTAGRVELAPMAGGVACQAVTSDTPYPLLAQILLENAEPCFVVDETGALVGQVSRQDLEGGRLRGPLDGIMAGDLARQVSTVEKGAPGSLAERKAEGTGGTVAVVEEATGRLIGALG